MTDFQKTTVTIGSVFKFLGVVVPVIGTLIWGYLNIMTKLTSLEYGINENNRVHITFQKDIDELKKSDKDLHNMIEEHIGVDDTRVKHQIIK